MIYFVRTENGGLIKIGTTVNLPARLASHRHVWPDLILVGVHDGGREKEQTVHLQFKHLRVASTHPSGAGARKELFAPGPDLLAYIKEHCRRPDLFDMLHETSGTLCPLRVDFAPETHRLLRLIAADAGVSMAAYARQALAALLREEVARRQIKVG